MAQIRDHLQQQAPGVGIAKDLHRLKADGTASADELRQFIGTLQGRSPEEVMGVVAQSNLFRSIVLAAAGCAVLLVALTIIPYVLRDKSTPTVTAPTTAATAAEAPADDTDATSSDAVADGSQPDLKRAADAMGIGDAAPADADPKQLDTKLENLLDGLD